MKRPPTLQIAGAFYYWGLWLLIAFLVASQFSCIFQNSVKWTNLAKYGQMPAEGLYQIQGSNDEPYSDRSFVCVLQGRTYAPVSINEALAMGTTKLVDDTGKAINGYRVVKRDTAVLVSEAMDFYSNMCSDLAATIDQLLATCSRLGYNVAHDDVRIVDDTKSTKMYQVRSSLPVVIMPFWDNCMGARLAIPGTDGSACMFRPSGSYTSINDPTPLMFAVSRSVREAKTVEFLKLPGGQWKNGWYEDPSGTKWYSDVITKMYPILDIQQRQFDMLTGQEQTCTNEDECATVTVEYWGSTFSCTTTEHSMASVAIANGERYGLFLYEGISVKEVKSIYDWETLLSNVLIAQVLLCWMVSMLALHRGYYLGVTKWCNVGISCLANSVHFEVLPLMLLPRMKMALFAFWSAGCRFEGQQQPFTEAWFLIYPAIIEVMFFYYSLLNSVGRLFRIHISDVLFGPTMLFFCAMHWSRLALANSSWFGIDGRITTVFYSDELEDLTLIKLLTTDVALRINGSIKSLFFIKLGVLAANLVPVVIGITKNVRASSLAKKETPVEGLTDRAESILAAWVANSGGLDHYLYFSSSHRSSTAVAPATDVIEGALNQYELLRLGYVVYGNIQPTLTPLPTPEHTAKENAEEKAPEAAQVFLVSFDDWFLLTQMAPLRNFTSLWNHRVKVFPLCISKSSGGASIASTPEMCRIDDPRLLKIHWWQVHVQSIK